MKIYRVYYHPQFRRSLLALPKEVQKIADRKIFLFKNNPFKGILKTHKLSGKLNNHWSFTIKSQYRVIFIFDNNDVIFLDIGSHDIYR